MLDWVDQGGKVWPLTSSIDKCHLSCNIRGDCWGRGITLLWYDFYHLCATHGGHRLHPYEWHRSWFISWSMVDVLAQGSASSGDIYFGNTCSFCRSIPTLKSYKLIAEIAKSPDLVGIRGRRLYVSYIILLTYLQLVGHLWATREKQKDP